MTRGPWWSCDCQFFPLLLCTVVLWFKITGQFSLRQIFALSVCIVCIFLKMLLYYTAATPVIGCMVYLLILSDISCPLSSVVVGRSSGR